MGEVAAVLQAVFEGARRAGGGVGEAVGEARAESLLGDVGEAVVGVAGESSESGVGTQGGGVAHRGRLLECDVDADAAAASGVFEGLFGLVAEAVPRQAVTEKSQGGEMGAGARATHPFNRRTWPRSTRRTIEGSITWMGMWKGRVCVCERVQEVLWNKEMCSERCKEGMCWKRDKCSLSDADGNVQRKRKVFAKRGGGALEVDELRVLVEDGSERSGTLGSDAVVSQTVSEGQDGKR